MKAESKKQNLSAAGAEHEKPSFSLSALSFRLGYDGKRAANNLTGLGNYSRSLIGHLADQFPENEYLVYTPKVKAKILEFPLFKKKNVCLKLPQNRKLLWRSFAIKKQLLKDQIDLYHGLSHEIPFGITKTGIKCVVTMHDLIFMRQPQYYKWIDRKIYEFKSRYACAHADHIVAISEQTKNDIVNLFGTDPAKIDVIYQSCDDSFKSIKTDAEKQAAKIKYQLPAKYLLYVGTVEARKNLLLLIRALPKIDLNYPLIVIGRATSYLAQVKAEIDRLGLQNRVIFLNSVPFFELPAIYQLASCFVLPSYYEGFGIPIIEALYSKVPVVAATGSCLEEAGGPDSLYVSPDDPQALADAINQVLSDDQLRINMIDKGYAYVQRFDNKIVNQQMMDCYLKTLGK